jgi:hypothetical protein
MTKGKPVAAVIPSGKEDAVALRELFAFVRWFVVPARRVSRQRRIV